MDGDSIQQELAEEPRPIPRMAYFGLGLFALLTVAFVLIRFVHAKDSPAFWMICAVLLCEGFAFGAFFASASVRLAAPTRSVD